jgi:hypothetical protein
MAEVIQYDWVNYIKNKQYKDFILYNMNSKTRVTRLKVKKQHSGCWSWLYFITALYYIRLKYDIDSRINENTNIIIQSIVNSVFNIIFKEKKEYTLLYKLIQDRGFAISNYVVECNSLKNLSDYTPMCIYINDNNERTIVHYFMILQPSPDTFYITSSWGSDLISIRPSITQITEKDYNKMFNLLKEIKNEEEKKELKQLIKKYFFIRESADTVYPEYVITVHNNNNNENYIEDYENHTVNNERGNIYSYPPNVGIEEELNKFCNKQHVIGRINGFMEEMKKYIEISVKEHERNSRHVRNRRSRYSNNRPSSSNMPSSSNRRSRYSNHMSRSSNRRSRYSNNRSKFHSRSRSPLVSSNRTLKKK